MINGLFSPSYKDARRRAISSLDWEMNSPNCFNVRGAGTLVSKQVTLTAAGNPVATDLFEITGHVKIFSLFAVFEDVTNVVDIEEVRYDVDDGGVQALLTSAAGVVCDGAALNSVLMKVDDNTNALTFMNADQVRIHESSKFDVTQPVSVNADDAATTHLRILYKNVDTNLNCKIRTYIEYRSLCGSAVGLITPV